MSCGSCFGAQDEEEEQFVQVVGNLVHVVAIINPNSCGAQAAISQLNKLKDRATVLLLERGGAISLDAACAKCVEEHGDLRFAAGGGDGTISAVTGIVADACRLAGLPAALPLAPLPLGTGNEAANVLGWGAGYGGGPLHKTIQQVARGRTVNLDRWRWQHTTSEGKRGEARDFVCFFSIGFDAAISHNFTLQRERNPSSCSTVAKNKAWYTWYGAKELFASESYIGGGGVTKLVVDGAEVALPAGINSLQVFNIHSSGDGIDFFGTGQASVDGELSGHRPPCVGDGLLEVVGTRGVADLLLVRTKIRHSHRLAQGARIEIHLAGTRPAQMDGETWMAEPGVIEISAHDAGPVPVVLGPRKHRNAEPRRAD
mmetsp:Transcript_2818/g.9530  ORF Transcript_2818/g.9530 Transcript_2818/m.9530 type:complete len:371 (+) Transcript_2818:1013-2125(+)